MNLFNSFQAVGFYTLLATSLPWLFQNGYQVWGYIGAAIVFVGYCFLSIAAHEAYR